jgi:methylphosphotriester-DNA--protein-cysteine methyltransferase
MLDFGLASIETEAVMTALLATQSAERDWRGIGQVLAVANELGAYTKLDEMLRRAVELARDRLALERVAIFLHDEQKGRMRGTFGTGPSGETMDERWHSHPVTPQQCADLRRLLPQGTLWNFYEDVELQVPRPSRNLIVGRGWNTITPLLAAGKVVGVMYVDTALSGAAFDAEKQAHAAVLCAAVASFVQAKRPEGTSKRSLGSDQPSRTVRRMLAALERDPCVRGQDLAQELRVSPGHLGRVFKMEMGASLVEYRNRLRLQSFFDVVGRGEANLIRAALGAGFGSYAQFHRVYRQLVGGTPRDLALGRQPAHAGGGTERARAYAEPVGATLQSWPKKLRRRRA